jgi:hypothetical protein
VRRLLPILAIVVLLLPVMNVMAAGSPVENTITLQGSLWRSGVPYSGLCDFKVQLWDDPTAGAQVGADIDLPGQLVANGQFILSLDAPGAWNGERRFWLASVKCTGDDDYVQLDPRHEITPAPMALWARQSDHAIAADSANTAITSTVASTATTSANADYATNAGSAITATTSHQADVMPWSGLTGLSCSPGQTVKWMGSDWECQPDLTSSIVYTSGIGTAGRVAQWLSTDTLGSSNVTLAASSPYTLTVPGTGTAALLEARNTFTLGPQTILTGADANKGLIVKGNSISQTANLQEWQNSSGSALVSIDPAGEIGIGHSPLSGILLYGFRTDTSLSGYPYSFEFLTNHNPPADSTAKVYSLWTGIHAQGNYHLNGVGTFLNQTYNDNTNLLDIATALNNQVSNTSSGTLTSATADASQVSNISSGTITTAYGTSALMTNSGSGKINTVYAQYSAVSASSGVITTAYGSYVNLGISSSGSINTAWGSRVYASKSGSGTIADLRGIYLSDMTAGSTNYGIYTNAGPNRFGDQVAVYGSANRTQLLAQAWTTQTTPLANFQNSAGTSLVLIGSGMAISGTDPGQGNLWVAGNVSADSYTDRTPGLNPSYDALGAVRQIKSVPANATAWTIDHTTLPTFASASKYFPDQVITTTVQVDPNCVVKTVVDSNGLATDIPCATKVIMNIIPAHTEKLRDVGAMVTVLTSATQQLDARYTTPPAHSTSTCTAGQYAADVSYFYFCQATNTWKRIAWAAGTVW